MKQFIAICLLCTFSTACFAQVIQGDRMLDIIGKPLNDPLLLQFRQQENFSSEFWNKDFSVYLDKGWNSELATLQLLNGQKRFQSEQRYGYFTKELPLGLSWTLNRLGFENKLGTPVKYWPGSPNTFDYATRGWLVRVEYEDGRAVMVNFKKDPDYVPVNPNSTTVLKLNERGNTEVNWPALKKLIVAGKNMRSFAGKDSVDYIGEVYYSTPYKVEGFEKTAIKRNKAKKYWYYEAFYKTNADSNNVRRIFFSIYDALKRTLKDSTADDFIFAAVAEDPISKDPMNWILAWSLFENYKTLPRGLEKIRITLGLSGFKNFQTHAMEYTLKFYVAVPDVQYDFFIWDRPQ